MHNRGTASAGSLFVLIVGFVGVLLHTASSAAALEFGAPFTDGAVLQRRAPVPVWGWAAPGAKVTVTFAGQSHDATAGDDGKWMVRLNPLVASFEPATLTVQAGDDQATVSDVLVGEVWMASGQSNMQWVAAKCDVGHVLQKQVAERVAAGQERAPVIREAKVTDYFAVLHPIEHAAVEWSADAGQASAVAWSFAYHLFRELEVPIGILNCSFSQTAIQAWTPREGFRDGTDDYTRSIYRQVLETDPSTPEHRAAWDAFYAAIDQTLADNARRVAAGEPAQPISTKTPGNLNGNRDATWLFNARTSPMIPYAIRGAIWNQGYANINEGLRYYENLHSMIRGWRLAWGRPDLPVYFHQFYSTDNPQDPLRFDSAAEMRLANWLARDIPHTGMASQIDVTGAIHYFNLALPGQRLALHALRNQYPDTTLKAGGKAADLTADGPMFKSYTVEGDKLIVTLDHAKGGLLVGETGTNVKGGLGVPTVITDGAPQVKLFYLADADRLWYPAQVAIDGERLVVTSPKVKSPRGVAYAATGVGNLPNIYNRALLPLTPFIYFDEKLVTSETWPEDALRVDGVEPDLSATGLLYEYRKMPLLSTQFRDHAVLQAGQPVTIWGSAVHDWGYEARGEALITLRFAGQEHKIPVTPGMREWAVTLPPMEASAEPKTLEVAFTIDGEMAHQRTCTDILIGDVWYVAAPPADLDIPDEGPTSNVRMMTRRAKRSSHHAPSRFSVSVSTTPDNRFASEWEPATGFAAALGRRIAAKTGQPVGVVFMQVVGGKDFADPPLKSWVPAGDLALAPSLRGDYEQLATLRPGNPFYDANAQRYVSEWRRYWSDYVPQLMATGRVPDAAPWGKLPDLSSAVTTEASETYNVLVHSFTPAAFKGVVFLTGPAAVEADEGRHFGEQLAALANSWKQRFACEDPYFFATVPARDLAPHATAPKSIVGRSRLLTIDQWPANKKADHGATVAIIERIVTEAYP